MPKKKLQRFADLATMPHVFQEPGTLQGNWCIDFFHNQNPITLELGCGSGEYTLALARMYPQNNVIGADLKGSRLWIGAKWAQTHQLHNTAFLRIFIEKIGDFFAPGEVDEIWITFPDPYRIYSKRNKRLTSPRFLDIYKKILKHGGLVHLKTDNDGLFRYTLKTVMEQGGAIKACVENIDEYPENDTRRLLRTKYEEWFRKKGLIIKYLCFSVH
jgi:tRNA (guanine-N7-)-methyltransferase